MSYEPTKEGAIQAYNDRGYFGLDAWARSNSGSPGVEEIVQQVSELASRVPRLSAISED